MSHQYCEHFFVHEKKSLSQPPRYVSNGFWHFTRVTAKHISNSNATTCTTDRFSTPIILPSLAISYWFLTFESSIRMYGIYRSDKGGWSFLNLKYLSCIMHDKYFKFKKSNHLWYAAMPAVQPTSLNCLCNVPLLVL
jgi:hypothetical protein